MHWKAKTNSKWLQRVTGQLADTPIRGLPTRGLDDSRTGQLAYWTTLRCQRRLCVLSFRSYGGICETASCPVTLQSTWGVQTSAVYLLTCCVMLSWYTNQARHTKVVCNAGLMLDTQKWNFLQKNLALGQKVSNVSDLKPYTPFKNFTRVRP